MAAAGAGKSTDPTTAVNSKKRKPNRNPTNTSNKLTSYPMFVKEPLLRRLSSAAAVAHFFLQSNDLVLLPSQSLSLESLLSSLLTSPSPPISLSDTWFHRFLISASEDGDPRWFQCFRMSRSTFFHLFSILSSPLVSSLPFDAPPGDHALAAAIFRLAHGASYNSLVTRFGFDTPNDASRAFFTVCKLINENLGQLDYPKPDYLPRMLPNCCGVLGFGRFEVEGELLGANGSLVVQALVDSNNRFLDISAGWPSTMKSEAIFRQTKFFSNVEAESRSFLHGTPCKLGNGMLVPQYILGNSCFPLLPWLLIPYTSSSSNEEEDSFELSRREFNNVVHTALQTVEIAFGRVRARWKILNKKWKQETIEFLPFVITTGCLLHNFLVNSGHNLQEELVDCTTGDNGGIRNYAEEEEEEEEEEDTRRFEGEAYVRSRRIRDAIAENLSRVRSMN